MKHLLQLILLALMPVVALAKDTQIKAVIFADTNDDRIGLSVQKDVAHFKKLVADVQKAVATEGVKTSLELYLGNNCSYADLNNYLDNLSCQDDIVFFIYGGHGGRSHSDTSKFPRMCLGSNNVSEWMKISDLNDKLRAKHPRLMVVMTDCCNSYYDRPRGEKEGALGAHIDTGNGEGFRQLFLHNKGEVSITGATAGEYGWGLAEGGIFTLNAIDAMYEVDAKGSAATWQDALQLISDKTYNSSLNSYNLRRITNTQRPVFTVNVTNADLDSPGTDVTVTDNDDIDDIDINVDNDNADDDLDDELYDDDDDGMGATGSLLNAFWIALFGFLVLNLPALINMSDSFASAMRIIGCVILIWALISFFINL